MKTKNLSKYELMTLAYYVAAKMEKDSSIATDKVTWESYHGFPVGVIDRDVYADFCEFMRIDMDDFTLQLAESFSESDAGIHYHLKGHQLVVALGEECGLPNPAPNAKVYIEGEYFEAEAGEFYYFTNCVSHNFHGKFHFINLQNPPLVDCEGHDVFVLSE